MNLFKKLFGGGRRRSKNVSVNVSIEVEEDYEEQYEEPVRLEKRSGFRSQRVEAFYESIKYLSHKEYPFLSNSYSPSSRMPCTDLIPFIVECLKANDIASIKEVMTLLIEANPGMGAESSWIASEVDQMLEIGFTPFVKFDNPEGYYYLQALWIVMAKEGVPETGFLLTKNVPIYAAYMVFAYGVTITQHTLKLVDRGNRWINRIGGDLPYWDDYGRISRDIIVKKPDNLEILSDKVLELSGLSRAILMMAVEKGSGRLTNVSTYEMRNIGLDDEQAAEEILETGLLKPEASVEALKDGYSRDELLKVAEELGIEVRKSWNKEKLATALIDGGGEEIVERATKDYVFTASGEHEAWLRKMLDYCKRLEEPFKGLCFAPQG